MPATMAHIAAGTGGVRQSRTGNGMPCCRHYLYGDLNTYTASAGFSFSTSGIKKSISKNFFSRKGLGQKNFFSRKNANAAHHSLSGYHIPEKL